jgi:hypothetical protein
MNGLIERIKGIILTPKEAFPRLASEPGNIAGLFTGYLAILAAIPAVAGFLRLSVIGTTLPFIGTVRVSPVRALVQEVVYYALSLALIYLLAIIVENIAPSFGGQKDLLGAARALGYSATPGLLAGILMIVPVLAPISLLVSLYGLYLLYLALPVFLKVPEDKAIVFTLAVVGIAIILFGVLFGIMSVVSQGGSGAPVTFRM